MMEALELLLQSGFQLERTLMLAFGHDEETGGQQGAMAMARLLKERRQHFEFILDEGTTITRGFFPGMIQPVAMIAIAEKGYLTLSLTTKSAGGHSSVPAKITAIGRLVKVVNRLQEQQLPKELSAPARGMLDVIGPAMPFTQRLVLANLWLFEPLVLQAMAKKPFTNAYIRTTIAPTMLSAGVKENVLPQSAQAIVNFRLLPGQSIEQVIEWVKEIIDDEQVAVVRHGNASSEPSKISGLDSLGYQELKRAVHQVFPDTITVPALLFAATDSRHYAGLSGQIFRFTPITIEPDDLKRIHGTNERIAIKDYQNAVRFYYQLIKNTVVVKQP
jgi:carboxypeptidase PM20D1